MSNGREVVITGVGIVSPIGVGKQAFWESLQGGRSGVAPLCKLQDTDLPVKFGAELKDFDPKPYVKPRKSLKVMCREIQTGYSAAMLALQDAGLESGMVDPDRFGAVMGSEMFYCDVDELAAGYRKCVVDGKVHPELWGESAMSDLYPLWMLKYLPNMVACHFAITQDARGPNNTIVLDEISSLLAMIEAANVIQRDHADVMLTGGSGTRVNLTRMMYRGDHAWSHRHDEPEHASRPFDAGRDGGVIGEGAGAMMLESRQHAEARGAEILGRVLGFGRSYDTAGQGGFPTVHAICQSIKGALKSSGLEANQIGHVNAHGTSMIEPDRIEATAIQQCLGDVPVTALKSFFGCLAAASGIVEAAGSVLGLAAGEVPMTLNYQDPDPACPVNVVHGEPLKTDRRVALLMSQSETGQAAAVVIAAE